jgi:small subunit ribosomal protein S21
MLRRQASEEKQKRLIGARDEDFKPLDTVHGAITVTRQLWTAGRGVVPRTCLHRQRGSDKRLTEIKLKKGESVEKALRRLKKRIDREGTLREVRNHRHYEKPSERRRRKMKVARFSAMLSARYADL